MKFEDLPRFDISSRYVQMFWRPYLGPKPFALWQTLVAVQEEVEDRAGIFHGEWPAIKDIAAIFGYGRHAMLGRAAYGDRPANHGAIGSLVHNGLVVVSADGEFEQNLRYRFKVTNEVSLLVPDQAATLRVSVQQAHYRFIAYYVPGPYAELYRRPRRRTVTNRLRRDILERDAYTCNYCGGPAATVDHVIPASRGGTHDMANLVAACAGCNFAKGNRVKEEAGLAREIQ